MTASGRHGDWQPEEHELPGADALRSATAQLRVAPLARAVEIADGVLRRALAAPRRAELVRSPVDPALQVSTVAITAVLRADVDAALSGAAVHRVLLDVGDDGTLEALTLDLLVQHGTSIPAVADQARAVASASLVGLLGRAPDRVTVQHVHVSDVTIGDPHVVDPEDEQVPPPGAPRTVDAWPPSS